MNKNLSAVVGKVLTGFEVSDDKTCVVLFFMSDDEPVVVSLFSAKEIVVE